MGEAALESIGQLADPRAQVAAKLHRHTRQPAKPNGPVFGCVFAHPDLVLIAALPRIRDHRQHQIGPVVAVEVLDEVGEARPADTQIELGATRQRYRLYLLAAQHVGHHALRRRRHELRSPSVEYVGPSQQAASRLGQHQNRLGRRGQRRGAGAATPHDDAAVVSDRNQVHSGRHRSDPRDRGAPTRSPHRGFAGASAPPDSRPRRTRPPR